jgi:4-hydroxy-2-oxoheptanedioate aldolase
MNHVHHELSLRARIRRGDTVVGVWCMTPNPTFTEIAASQGLDFVIVDMEHGAVGLSDLPDLLRGLSGSRTAGLVRVPSHDPTFISRAMDRGAQGVIVPRVDTPEAAAMVAAACRFPPVGMRGLALPGIRASGYGSNADYRDAHNDGVLVAVQIESGIAVEHAVAIGTAPGVDLAFVGPNDLSAEMGMESLEDRPRFIEVLDATFRKLAAAGVPTGTVPHSGRTWQQLAAVGVQLHAVASDVGLMRDGVKSLLSSIVEHQSA